MRIGDVYRIQSMLVNGQTEEDILHFFRWDYDEDEVRKFLPKNKTKRPVKKTTGKQADGDADHGL